MRPRWSRVVVLILVAGTYAPGVAHAMAGKLDRPGIAIPGSGADGKSDPVVLGMNRVLASHAKEFTSGYFVNSYSILHYEGGTKTINALLDELARSGGVTLDVRFSRSPTNVPAWFPGEKPAAATWACSIEHDAWGSARTITLTINLGADGLDLGGLLIPSIRGR